MYRAKKIDSSLEKEFTKLKEDAAKCKRNWDEVDRWASGNEMNDDDPAGYFRYHTFENPYIEPFFRSKYIKRHGLSR